jgi:PAS domain S-box-containing protein
MPAVLSTKHRLSGAIRALREIVERRLRTYSDPQHDTRPSEDEELRTLELGIEELNALWEELEGRADRLAVERERYAELFAFAPDAFIVTDGHGNIREANVAASELMHKSTAHLIGKPLSALMCVRHRSRFRTALNEVAKAGGAARRTWRGAVRRGDGSETDIELSVGRAGNSTGNATRLCWLLRPVS